MTCRILTFPSKAKPRVVLHVPTSDLVVRLWAELNDRIQDNWHNPCEHNERMMAAARARYIAALIAENESA